MKGGNNMKMGKIGVALSIAFIFVLNFVSAQQYGMMSMMNMMTGYGGYGAGTMLLGWITYLLTIGLMIAGIYCLVKTANKRR